MESGKGDLNENMHKKTGRFLDCVRVVAMLRWSKERWRKKAIVGTGGFLMEIQEFGKLQVCKDAEDAKDVVQDTFIQYHTSTKDFTDEQHIRAWLFRVALNRAKDINRSFWRKHKVSLEDYTETLPFAKPADHDLFDAVMQLPEKYRIVIHLFYYEDYRIHEIADILKISESNVKVRLSRGRTLLKDVLKEEWSDDE